MSTENEQAGFSTAHLLKSKAILAVDTVKPRAKVSYNEKGEGQLPQIIFVTRTVTIQKESVIEKTVKAIRPVASATLKGVVAPVSFLGYIVIFLSTLLYRGVQLWCGSFNFVGNIFRNAVLNISYVILTLAVLSIPWWIAYFGSMYIRPLYDFYHSENYFMLGLSSVGIFLAGSVIVALLIGFGKKLFFTKSTEQPTGTSIQ